MTLSEAIRLGAMLRAQGFGELIVDGKTCALGAACEALGIPIEDLGPRAEERLSTLFPALDETINCPICYRRSDVGIGTVIVHLNDDHLWTRERIADWVATLEADATKTETSVVQELTKV